MQAIPALRDPEGIHNFRQLGPYPVSGDRCLRAGMVYRSGALDLMTDADHAWLRAELGIQTVLDLRHPDELPARTSIHGLADRVIPLSVFSEEQRQADISAELNGLYGRVPSPQRYLHYLDLGGERLARAFTLFADASRYPILVHCTAGKDRTGVLVGIIMEVLGCSVADIASEYELSEASTDRLIAYLRATGWPLEGTDSEIRERLSTPGERMAGFIELLRVRYGGAEEFLAAKGVSSAAISTVRDLLTTKL